MHAGRKGGTNKKRTKRGGGVSCRGKRLGSEGWAMEHPGGVYGAIRIDESVHTSIFSAIAVRESEVGRRTSMEEVRKTGSLA